MTNSMLIFIVVLAHFVAALPLSNEPNHFAIAQGKAGVSDASLFQPWWEVFSFAFDTPRPKNEHDAIPERVGPKIIPPQPLQTIDTIPIENLVFVDETELLITLEKEEPISERLGTSASLVEVSESSEDEDDPLERLRMLKNQGGLFGGRGDWAVIFDGSFLGTQTRLGARDVAESGCGPQPQVEIQGMMMVSEPKQGEFTFSSGAKINISWAFIPLGDPDTVIIYPVQVDIYIARTFLSGSSLVNNPGSAAAPVWNLIVQGYQIGENQGYVSADLTHDDPGMPAANSTLSPISSPQINGTMSTSNSTSGATLFARGSRKKSSSRRSSDSKTSEDSATTLSDQASTSDNGQSDTLISSDPTSTSTGRSRTRPPKSTEGSSTSQSSTSLIFPLSSDLTSTMLITQASTSTITVPSSSTFGSSSRQISDTSPPPSPPDISTQSAATLPTVPIDLSQALFEQRKQLNHSRLFLQFFVWDPVPELADGTYIVKIVPSGFPPYRVDPSSACGDLPQKIYRPAEVLSTSFYILTPRSLPAFPDRLAPNSGSRQSRSGCSDRVVLISAQLATLFLLSLA